MPKVSVIMATYNRARLLQRAIASVLTQTFGDFEVIVVDDGSTDDTAAAVSAMSDPRIRYLYQENSGLAAGRNTGIRAARGDYIAFLDDDDTYLPHKLAVQVAALDVAPDIGWVSGGYRAVDESGRLLEEIRPWLTYPALDVITWLFACPTVVHAVLIRRSCLEKIGGFNPERKRSDDWDCWLWLAHAGCRMAWQPEIVAEYYFHSSNMVRDVSIKSKENLEILREFFGQPGITPALLAVRDEALAQMHLRNAAAAFHAQDIESARDALANALRLNPRLGNAQGQPVIDMLLGFAFSPLVADPFAYVHTVLAYLDDPLFAIDQRWRSLLGQIYMGIFFRAADREDWRRVCWAWPRGVWHAPAWLRNRGAWSIWTRALVRQATGGRGTV